MKRLGLLLCITTTLVSMQEEYILTTDAYEHIKDYVMLQCPQQRCFPLDNLYFSNNFAQFYFPQPGESTVAYNVALFNNSFNNAVELLVRTDKGNLQKESILRKGGACSYSIDGPNDNNYILTAHGLYVMPSQNSAEVFDESCPKKNMLKNFRCWCKAHTMTKEMIFKFYAVSDFASQPELDMVTTVALHKKEALFMLAHTYLKQQIITCFTFHHKDEVLTQVAHGIYDGAPIKKISFLTGSRLLALDTEGNLLLIAVDQGKILVYPQLIYYNEAPVVLRDMAVDQCNPTQLVMLFADGRLVHGDVTKHTYVPLTKNKNIKTIKYYNDIVTLLHEDNTMFYSYQVYPLKHRMIEKLLENKIELIKK